MRNIQLTTTLVAILFSAVYQEGVVAQQEVDPVAFQQLIQEGALHAIIDVRAESEWNEGHIENATFVENLASDSSKVDALMGCEFCDLGVYCFSGVRAGRAIRKLRDAGFQGRLYNGQGVSQWKAAGLPLVQGPSVPAPCTVSDVASDQCKAANLANPPTSSGSFHGIVTQWVLFATGFAAFILNS